MNIDYYAMPPQYRFLRSQAQFAGLFGGIGSGKSHVGCFWALTKALRNPRCLGLIGANSYRQLRDATLRTFEMLLRHYDIGYTFRGSDMTFCLETGAEILCRSMETYDLLRGIELGWFYLDELRDTRPEAWQVIKGRLRSRASDALEGRVTSSPNGFDWIYEEFVRKPVDPATAEGYRTHEAFFARTVDNKHLPREYLASLLATYDPRLAAQELDGRFVNITQGRIYHAFDRDAHVTREADFVPGQPILWSLDFNVTPMTAVVAQWDPGVAPSNSFEGASSAGRGKTPSNKFEGATLCGSRALRIIDELWLENSSTLAMCEAFGEWLRDFGLRIADCGMEEQEREAEGSSQSAIRNPHSAIYVYGDAAGAARSTSGRSDYAIIRECFPSARLCVGAVNPQRRDRYNAVNAAFLNARGETRLRVHPRCRHLIDDLERVTYQRSTNEPDTSDPLRGHIADALGYLVARVMPAGRTVLAAGQW